jgi:MFS family permease
MSSYSIALFLHIVGAFGFFVVQGLEWIGLSQIRRARLPDEARVILRAVKSADRLGFISMPITIITGIYMLLTAWGWVPWILVVLEALVLEIVLFVVLAKPRMATIEQALVAETEFVSRRFHDLVNDPILWISIHTRVAIIIGIVFLKIAKPDLGGSLLTIIIAIIIGITSMLPALRHERAQAGSAARIVMAFLVPAFVAALGLLAANSTPASTIPLSNNKSDIQDVQTKPFEVSGEVDSSNSSTQAPIASPGTALQEGQLLLQTRCTQCHSLEKVQQGKKTRSEWEETLSKMEGFNVKISDTEKQVLLDYLTTADHP